MQKTFTVTATIKTIIFAESAADAVTGMEAILKNGDYDKPKITASQQNVITEDMFTRVNSDSFGNPRYVIHFLNFFNEDEDIKKYDIAIKRAKSLDGRKFDNKQYGGGIVFQSYNINDDAKHITEMLAKLKG